MGGKLRVWSGSNGKWVAQYDNDGEITAPPDAWAHEFVTGAWAEHKEGVTRAKAIGALHKRLRFLGIKPPPAENKIASLP